jgi:superfamily II DNA or RNA helicase
VSTVYNTRQGQLSRKHIGGGVYRVKAPVLDIDDDVDDVVASSEGVDQAPWPEKYPPRPYLQVAVERSIAAVDTGKRGIVHLPTGTGKTVKAAKVIDHYYRKRKRALFLHHRRELRSQTLAKFLDFGLCPEIEESGSRASQDSLNPVIASVLSLQGRRLAGWPKDAFDLILTDECHHAEAAAYQHIYDHFDVQAHIGITATVDRYDRKPLLRTYPDSIIYSYSLLDAVQDGWLVHPKAVRVGIRPDLRKCKLVAGDFVASELDTAISGHLSDIAASLQLEIGSRRTVVFTPTVASARALAERLCARHLPASAVWGTCQDRDDIISKFRCGTTQIVVNCAILGEGVDVPEIEAVVLCRPTRSRSLYAQMIGRGLRICPGKDLLLIVDFQWLTRKHQLLMDPTRLLLADELPAVQALAEGREPTDDPVADIRRVRATYLHAIECAARMREESWLLLPPPDILSRADAPPEWLRPSAKQVQAMRSFDIQGWDRMNRAEAAVAIGVAANRPRIANMFPPAHRTAFGSMNRQCLAQTSGG